MILHDFQRGRLPYFVPPKSETDDKINKDIKNSNEKVPHVEQNFESLTVGPEFQGDDLDKSNKDNLADKNSGEISQDMSVNMLSDNEEENNSEIESPKSDLHKRNSKELSGDDLIDSSLLETLSAEEKKFLRINESSQSKGIT